MKHFLIVLGVLVALGAGVEATAWITRPDGLFPRTPLGYAAAWIHHSPGVPNGPALDLVDGQSCGYTKAEADLCGVAIINFEDEATNPRTYPKCVQKLTQKWGTSWFRRTFYQKPPVMTQCSRVNERLADIGNSCEPHMLGCLAKFGRPAFYYTDVDPYEGG